jgi:hypothetical protein
LDGEGVAKFKGRDDEFVLAGSTCGRVPLWVFYFEQRERLPAGSLKQLIR